jgi:putative intracellular protease/amidase
MKKAAVLIEDHYQVLEAWYPYLRLREENFETVFVGPGRKKNIKAKKVIPHRKKFGLTTPKQPTLMRSLSPADLPRICSEGTIKSTNSSGRCSRPAN